MTNRFVEKKMAKMRPVLVLLLLLSVTVLSTGLFPATEPAGAQDVRHIAAESLQKLVADQAIQLIDVRTPQEFAQRRLDLGERLITLDTLPYRLHELPQDRDAALVFVCRTTNRATQAAQRVRAAGWRNVAVLQDGVAGWPSHPDTFPSLIRFSPD